jgi:uncharacterized RDD family membrane protein YckC
MLFAFVYLVALKSSSIRTVGYRLVGVRIVNHKGERPSFLFMAIRLLSWMLGPVHPSSISSG